jgi:hypothetical protein
VSVVVGWRALSLRQPWLWMVLHGKSIENRSRNLGLPHESEPFLLHASSSADPGYGRDAWAWVRARLPDVYSRWGAEHGGHETGVSAVRGAFCGVARIVGMLSPRAAGRGRVLVCGGDDYDLDERRSLVHRGRDYDLRWWMRDADQVGYLLADVRDLAPVTGPGKRGFFRVGPAVVAALGLPETPSEWGAPCRS